MATAVNSAAPSAPRPGVTAPNFANDGGTYPTDEAILGITDEPVAYQTRHPDPGTYQTRHPDPVTNQRRHPESDTSQRRHPEPDLLGEGYPALVSQAGVSSNENTVANGSLSFGANPAPRPNSSGRETAPQDDVADIGRAGDPQSAPIPEWLAQISAAAPNAAPELAHLWERATALDTFDRAFYGADASAQQQLITQLYSDDPATFRAMVSAANALVAPGSERGNDFVARPASPAVSAVESVGAGPFDATNTHPSGTSPSAHDQSSSGNHTADRAPSLRGTPNIADGIENPRPYETGRATNTNSPQNFNPVAYAQFEQSTNEAVVSDVSRAIDRAITRALPDGIADGARRRIAGDTLAEVHTALRGDRQLASQVAAILRGSLDDGSVARPRFVGAGNLTFSSSNSSTENAAHVPRFDTATRDAIARLISTRARGVVPEAARRVISEWTGSVLSAHRERSARQQSAGARVDVVGSERQSPQPRRAVKSTDINYRATSDEDILSW